MWLAQAGTEEAPGITTDRRAAIRRLPGLWQPEAPGGAKHRCAPGETEALRPREEREARRKQPGVMARNRPTSSRGWVEAVEVADIARAGIHQVLEAPEYLLVERAERIKAVEAVEASVPERLARSTRLAPLRRPIPEAGAEEHRNIQAGAADMQEETAGLDMFSFSGGRHAICGVG